MRNHYGNLYSTTPEVESIFAEWWPQERPDLKRSSAWRAFEEASRQLQAQLIRHYVAIGVIKEGSEDYSRAADTLDYLASPVAAQYYANRFPIGGQARLRRATPGSQRS
jgi:hypothetical protein